MDAGSHVELGSYVGGVSVGANRSFLHPPLTLLQRRPCHEHEYY